MCKMANNIIAHVCTVPILVKNCSCYNSMQVVVWWTRNQTINWSGLNIIYVCTVPHDHIKAVFKMLCLGEINAFTLSTLVLRINPVQQYDRLKLVTMEIEKLCTNTITTSNCCGVLYRADDYSVVVLGLKVGGFKSQSW